MSNQLGNPNKPGRLELSGGLERDYYATGVANVRTTVLRLAINFRGGDFVYGISRRNPVSPVSGPAHEIAAVNHVDTFCTRVKIGSPRPDVTSILQKMLPQSPSRQII